MYHNSMILGYPILTVRILFFLVMIQHYIKIILRTLLKSKIYTLLNVAGLSTGMVVLRHDPHYLDYHKFQNLQGSQHKSGGFT